jgi:activating signal cointegrator 1
MWQPWAHLFAIGYKTFETRSWSTNHRGKLLIHAAKKWDNELETLCKQEPFRSYVGVQSLSFGAIIGSVEIVDVKPTKSIRDKLPDRERAFGDFSDGRFAWQASIPELFEKPIPYAGKQGLFDVPQMDLL